MLRLLLITSLIAPVLANAECYTRSSSVNKSTGLIERITDISQTQLPDRCRVTFRALIDSKWHTVEGEALGTGSQICAMAINNGRIKILEKVSDSTLTASQELVCTDQNIPESKPLVKVGDLVRESEVRVHPIYPNAFLYRGSQCRWFIESVPQAGKIEVNQGIICNSFAQNAWRVVDKW